ncbi:MAG: hypothetical protein ACI8S6_000838 [Myxococcota bacterium]|jgi:hypothetical protein
MLVIGLSLVRCVSSSRDSGPLPVAVSCEDPTERSGSYIWTRDDPGLVCAPSTKTSPSR